jgi:hypothetical protein
MDLHPILKIFFNMDLNRKQFLAIYGIFILMPEILMGSNHYCTLYSYNTTYDLAYQLPTSNNMMYSAICERYELKIDYVAMDQVCTWSHYKVDILLYD